MHLLLPFSAAESPADSPLRPWPITLLPPPSSQPPR